MDTSKLLLTSTEHLELTQCMKLILVTIAALNEANSSATNGVLEFLTGYTNPTVLNNTKALIDMDWIVRDGKQYKIKGRV